MQFYIKDTKSSNGTFVNESRLSPSGEESGPVELKSRDVLQFGVNVNVERRGICTCRGRWGERREEGRVRKWGGRCG